MAKDKNAQRFKINYKAEMEAIDLYRRLADAESNAHLKEIYVKLIATDVERGFIDFVKT